jgi:hypothetical protein
MPGAGLGRAYSISMGWPAKSLRVVVICSLRLSAETVTDDISKTLADSRDATALRVPITPRCAVTFVFGFIFLMPLTI